MEISINQAGLINNATSLMEYDFHGSLKRVSCESWLPGYGSNGHILNLPTSLKITDGAGAFAAQTDFKYDNYSPAMAASGAVNLVSKSAARGNLTDIVKYVRAGTPLPPYHFAYDDAGNVLSQFDPLGETTTWSYTDNFANAACAPPTGQAAAYPSRMVNGTRGCYEVEPAKALCAGLVRFHDRLWANGFVAVIRAM